LTRHSDDVLRLALASRVRRRYRNDQIRHGRGVSFGLYEPATMRSPVTRPPSGSPPRISSALSQRASQSKCSPSDLRAMLTAICQELRPRLSCDHEASGVVRCWEDGSMERDIVMQMTGLTEAGYERTVKRLFYASRRRLPPELREAAQDLLRKAS